MANQTVTSEGIFHGMPTFPDHDGKSYTAIVAGANGISGAHIVRALAKTPRRWSKIFALSRKPPTDSLDGPVTSVAVDFLEEPEIISEILGKNNVSA